jgi:tRNA nucleotidyltransferase (CCA-adding enzyme)
MLKYSRGQAPDYSIKDETKFFAVLDRVGIHRDGKSIPELAGELAELAPERIWQELARGLMEPQPSRMLAILRECGALARLLPEVDALFGVRGPRAGAARLDAASHVFRTLDCTVARGHALPVRYAVLAHDLGAAPPFGSASRPPDVAPPRHGARTARSVRLAERMSARLKVPVDCRDAARLTARWQATVHRASELRPARLLDLLLAADALRRPERLDALLDACACVAETRKGAGTEYAPARILRGALAVVKQVDAGAIARSLGAGATAGTTERSTAIAAALRVARLKALRASR